MNIREQFEITLGAIVSIACIGIAVASFLDVLGPFAMTIPTLTLLLLGTVSLYLVVERRSRFARLDDTVEKRTQALQEALRELRGTIDDIRIRLTQVDAFFGAATSTDRLSQLKLIYGARALAGSISTDSVSVGRDYVFQIWVDCVSTADTILAFNYVKPEEVWRTGWAATIAHGAQIARIAAGATIRRVFVVESQEEARVLAPLMTLQTDAGIDVRWALHRDILSRPTLVRYLDDFGTWDLMAFDEDLILRVHLDSERSMDGGTVTRSSHLNARVKYIFNEAYEFGHRDIPLQDDTGSVKQ